MLAVSIFVAVFLLLAVGAFTLAMRAGADRDRANKRADSRGGRAATNVVMLVVYLGFGIAIPILLLTGNHSNASAQVGGMHLTQAEKDGRTLFGEHCGICHTLLAANAVGKIGPNLDQLKPPASLVLNTINHGCVQQPASQSAPDACLGYGTMPAQVVQGKDAQDVAQFVAKVAGKA